MHKYIHIYTFIYIYIYIYIYTYIGGDYLDSLNLADYVSKEAILRKGKWTTEEEDYATKLISLFNRGLLTVEPGTTLRGIYMYIYIYIYVYIYIYIYVYIYMCIYICIYIYLYIS
jgi:hypothetical protein